MSDETTIVRMNELDERIAEAVLEDAIYTIKKYFNTMVSKKDIDSSMSISISLNLGKKCSTYTTFDFTNFDTSGSIEESFSEVSTKSPDA